MRRTGIFVGLTACVGLLVVSAATIDVRAGDEHERGKREVALRDDCDPRDPAWTPTGGCSLREGDVTAGGVQQQPPVPARAVGDRAPGVVVRPDVPEG